MLAIDGFCWKRYNADPDGERESTVPIILTVGKVARAFPTGSVKGGVRCQSLTHIQSVSVLLYVKTHVIVWHIYGIFILRF